jgi:hypothetical protein
MDVSFSEAKGMFATAIDLMKKGSQMEAQAKIQELQEKYLGLHAENLEIKQELIELKAKAKELDQMVFEEPFFFELDGEDKAGPFCPKCWQKDQKKCRVVPTPDSYHGSHQCQVCSTNYGKGKSVPTPKVRTTRSRI